MEHLLRKEISEMGGSVIVTWYHDKPDEDMIHSGKEPETHTGQAFRFESK